MRIHLTSVYVDDQDKALRFYTEILGFEKKEEFPVGEYRWLTVVSPAEHDGTRLLLEPDAHPLCGRQCPGRSGLGASRVRHP
jgi:catechol 2,3-dioxygenase-like lactoylglutathione lyase family enzyme